MKVWADRWDKGTEHENYYSILVLYRENGKEKGTYYYNSILAYSGDYTGATQ